MATIYKAYQPSLDRYVAIKVLPTYLSEQDDTFAKRFEREARSIAKLRHPNILMVHDSGEHQGVSYIVMEYVDAGTFKDYLLNKPGFAQAATLISQVASALNYAHEQGVIHRDVKPQQYPAPKTRLGATDRFWFSHHGRGQLSHPIRDDSRNAGLYFTRTGPRGKSG